MIGPVLKVENLSFGFSSSRILNKVSFDLFPGDFVAIMGPNGAGKSTLLRCLCGVLPHSSGRISLGGRQLEAYSRKEIARRIGYVPQDFSSEVRFTVSEFVLLSRYPVLGRLNPCRSDDIEALDSALEKTQTAHLRERFISELSGGERQRVLLASVLAQQAEILLLDEPTAFLDPGYRKEMMEVLADLRNTSNLSVLFVTHDINSGALVSDRILGLRQGEIIFSGVPEAFMKSSVLKGLFDHDFPVVAHPDSGESMVLPAVCNRSSSRECI